MNDTWRVIFFAGTLLAGCTRHSMLPVQEFFRNPETTEFRISPQGRQISFLKPSGEKGRLNLFVQPLAGGAAKCVTSEEERDILPYYFWKDEDHIVYFVDLVANPNCEWRVRCVDLKTAVNSAQDRTPPGFIYVLEELRDDPVKILVQTGRDVARLNILNGQTEPVETNPGDVDQWIVNQAGEVLAAITRDGVNLCLETREDPQGVFERVLDMDFRESISPKSYDFDEIEPGIQPEPITGISFVLTKSTKGRPLIYALSNIRGAKCRDKVALVKIDPRTGQEVAERYANPKFDVSGIEISRKRGVTCATFTSWRNERKCLDHSSKLLYRRLQRHFRNDDVLITAYDDSEAKLIVRRSSDQNPGEYYLFERATGSLKKLGEVAPQLKGHLAPIKPISFASRTGRVLNGYLTLPLQHGGTSLPLIAVPHGGPWDARDIWGFNRPNREIQFLADRGYAVLQVNYRGSMGYGREFWESGFKQWGRQMQDDITDGVLWAIKQKIADPKRIGIVGESYGGYAALAGIAFTRDLPYGYAAAIDRAGISDLPMLFNEYLGNPMWRELAMKIGDPNHEDLLLNSASPALHCDKITTPLFIAHGCFDRQVPPEQSTKMRDALAARQVKVEIKWLPEGHIFQNEENLIAYYEAVEAFLDEHLRKR
jgi:dipeptidyl aminopeptidase/acylaminoacyl peptidase